MYHAAPFDCSLKAHHNTSQALPLLTTDLRQKLPLKFSKTSIQVSKICSKILKLSGSQFSEALFLPIKSLHSLFSDGKLNAEEKLLV